ncbi:MAG TPA: hydantoinase/oxoprolinase family protein [Acidimicrobiia bacterium]|nr:hydantoinase/oxoprolinase family protein [Acidimicrobiia bacterium]
MGASVVIGPPMTLGVDVGGTFTDLAWWDGASLRVGKTTTTTDQSEGVVGGARRLTVDRRVGVLVHGTTVATNALLERRGAGVALITDPGFEDVLEIGRQDRPSLYDHDVLRPEVLVPRHLRFSATPESLLDVDIVAVCLLESYADPAAERGAAAAVRSAHPGTDVVLSSQVSGEFREFERMSTTVLTAYLRPVVERYLGRLEHDVVPGVADRLAVMQSSGGLLPASRAGAHAASILLSGPAGGVVAAAAFGDLLGHEAVISFDMGGTSTDVCRIEGGVPEVSFERSVEGYACRLPSVAIHTVGAGGGSVAWLDPGGALRVGPRSAGALPGPAAYGRGGEEATVTDADLVLGLLGTDVPLADGLRLDSAASRASLDRVASQMALSTKDAALGVVEIVEAHMERAIRRVSVEEGFDPAAAALVAFGGAGGMHAAALAARLGMSTVIVPPHAGVLSALGLLLSNPRIDVARTILADPFETERVMRVIAELSVAVAEEFREAVGADPVGVAVSLDMRYVGQSHETSVAVFTGQDGATLVDRFHAVHHRRNGFHRLGDPVEIVTVRVSAEGRPALTVDQLAGHRPTGEAVAGRRTVLTQAGAVEATVLRRAGMEPGSEVRGPLVVVDAESTTWVGSESRALMHPSGALVIET